ncbi:amidohydrolase family protein [Pseudomonas japonica]|uniref:amidohydrolase family protein n=1 Tax=Pseudomonas japonica TaxID=256466 RepID=UPI0015E2AC4C|nr:amidohydrolase family protein [Pseudomonas japonica]MBA1244504.1 amidohydrolase family protein [Pseudomonas japonica]
MIFDAHCHIIDPRFPLIPNQGYLPPAFDAAAYQAQAVALGIAGGAVVSGSFQGFDQSYLLDALGRLGEGFVGVTQVPADITDDALAELDAHRVRALRFNLRRGGSEPLEQLERMAVRVHQGFGWHVELYVDSRDLSELAPRLSRLPALSIDHLGLSAEGLPYLLRLVEQGARVKACGFGRVDFAVAPALQQLHAANPEALMFGSDLPSTRAPRPFEATDITLIGEALGEAAARAVLWENARRFYRLA